MKLSRNQKKHEAQKMFVIFILYFSYYYSTAADRPRPLLTTVKPACLFHFEVTELLLVIFLMRDIAE
jgi:hypothetical protein